jgi:transcriptional regulator PpsR
LFDASNDAVMVLKVANLRILEANPAALRALDLPISDRDQIAGQDFLSTLQPEEREAFQDMLARVREQGKAPGMVLHLGQDRKSWSVRVTLVTSEPGAVFLVQLAPIGGALPPLKREQTVSVEELVERAADGFVVIDQDGIIRHANQAFLDLIEVRAKSSVVGERLSRWLWRPGADVSVLLSHVNRQRFVRLFSTIIHGELGTDTEIEISAAASNDTSDGISLLLRDVSRRLIMSNTSDNLRTSLGSITEQVGKTPLRTLVRNTVGVVERHYVKAALELAEGNRTAAAEILGLSRQSLYAKLNRYGLEGEVETAPGE